MPNSTEFLYASQQGKEVFVITLSSVSYFVALLYCCLVDRLLPAFMKNTFLYLLARVLCSNVVQMWNVSA